MSRECCIYNRGYKSGINVNNTLAFLSLESIKRIEYCIEIPIGNSALIELYDHTNNFSVGGNVVTGSAVKLQYYNIDYSNVTIYKSLIDIRITRITGNDPIKTYSIRIFTD